MATAIETAETKKGKAIVQTLEGNGEFGAGDYVAFPKGLKCT